MSSIFIQKIAIIFVFALYVQYGKIMAKAVIEIDARRAKYEQKRSEPVIYAPEGVCVNGWSSTACGMNNECMKNAERLVFMQDIMHCYT